MVLLVINIFRYYKLANAEAITLSGQVSIRWIENKMNDYLNKLLKTEDIDYVILHQIQTLYTSILVLLLINFLIVRLTIKLRLFPFWIKFAKINWNHLLTSPIKNLQIM